MGGPLSGGFKELGMLQLRPNCECCGELVARPRRPAGNLAKFPASIQRIFKPQGCGKTA